MKSIGIDPDYKDGYKVYDFNRNQAERLVRDALTDPHVAQIIVIMKDGTTGTVIL